MALPDRLEGGVPAVEILRVVRQGSAQQMALRSESVQAAYQILKRRLVLHGRSQGMVPQLGRVDDVAAVDLPAQPSEGKPDLGRTDLPGEGRLLEGRACVSGSG